MNKEWEIRTPISVFSRGLEAKGQGPCLTEMGGALASGCFGHPRSSPRVPIPPTRGQLNTQAGQHNAFGSPVPSGALPREMS